MALLEGAVAIECDDHILRARRTAAITRATIGAAGFLLILLKPGLLSGPALGLAGFTIIALTATVQLCAPRMRWLQIEESLAAVAAILIVGLQDQQVTALSMLWLAAVASGVMARGGRVHWIGRTVVLIALALPVIRQETLHAEYMALCVASLGLLLTSGRLTRELNHMLRQARHDAENAETLLLAGDIAARVAKRGDAVADGQQRRGGELLRADERTRVEAKLERLIAGEGLSMAVQPIVEVRTGRVHAYEALARFTGSSESPLHWLALAGTLDRREALERACLGAALALFVKRPPGTGFAVNLSAPVLLDPLTLQMFDHQSDLDGLIIEITEETLIQSDAELRSVIAPLQERGARLAVDDMGAGYSGLRQITTVRPSYLKLDRSLISGIDHDQDRAALVGALVGYSEQVGSLVVAEGVEHSGELRVLTSLGVPLVQGYYTARPGTPWPEVRMEASPELKRDPAYVARDTATDLDWVARDAASVDAPNERSLLPI